MKEEYLIVVFGVALLLASRYVTHHGYVGGLLSSRGAPRYPVTKRLRIAIFCVGILSLLVGFARIWGW